MGTGRGLHEPRNNSEERQGQNSIGVRIKSYAIITGGNMKNTLFAILLICATGAAAQNIGVLSNEPQPLVISDHPRHASVHRMAQEQNVFGEESPYTYAQGERPLSDFARASASVPLGDIARTYRKEHASVKKARIVWDN